MVCHKNEESKDESIRTISNVGKSSEKRKW